MNIESTNRWATSYPFKNYLGIPLPHAKLLAGCSRKQKGKSMGEPIILELVAGRELVRSLITDEWGRKWQVAKWTLQGQRKRGQIQPGDQPRNSCEIPGKSWYRLAFGRGFRNERRKKQSRDHLEGGGPWSEVMPCCCWNLQSHPQQGEKTFCWEVFLCVWGRMWGRLARERIFSL